jgi:hypothetical protein
LMVAPVEVGTDAAAIHPAVLEELPPAAWHHVERHANNPIEADHSQLKHRLGPRRGLRTEQTAQVIISGHAFIQNLRRGHYELAVDAPGSQRVATRVRRARAGRLTSGRSPDRAPTTPSTQRRLPWNRPRGRSRGPHPDGCRA